MNARLGGFAHSTEAFAAMAAELAGGASVSPLSATRLFGWLGTDGGDRLARRIERLLPGGRLLILALPNTLAAGLELRPGDLLVRVARGQRFGWVTAVAGAEVVRAGQLAARGWRGEGDPDPLPGNYVRVSDPAPWGRDDGRPLARRVATGAGLVPLDTMLLRLQAVEGREPEAAGGAGEDARRPILRLGSRGEAVREAQTSLNSLHARIVQDGGAGLTDCPLTVDGVFGARTQSAVRAFQHLAFPDQPREWDGIVGPHTWTALDARSIGPSPPPTPLLPTPPLPVPPLPVPPLPVPPLPVPATAVAAGREVVQHLPMLAAHRGTAPDLILKWNDMASVPHAVDVVVHLHGHSGARAAMRIDSNKEPISGLDFADPHPPHEAGRSAPTLLLLPRGNSNQNDSGNGYDFPAIVGPGGLEQLVGEALSRFASRIGAARVAPGRLILTAHSGGGAALIALLTSGRDPDEVHIFDAFYQDPAPVADWARRRLAAGSPDPALRVIYLDGGSTASRSGHFAPVVAALVPHGDPRARRLRVEATTVDHNGIPPRFGWRLLRDAGEDLPLGIGPASPPTTPPPAPSAGPLGQDAVDRLAAITFSNAAELNAVFAPLRGFQDWFNAELAGTGPFRRPGGGGALRMPTDAAARARFDGFWDRLSLAYDAPRISLLEFASLICIVMNETDGDFAARTESSGRGRRGRADASGPHPGLAYFFDSIQLRSGRRKASYNRLGRSAGSLFNDADFIAAHGVIGGAAQLAGHGDAFGGVWNGERYPQDQFSVDETDDSTAFIRETDFYKFRGRGIIQTTGRGAYVPFVSFVQSYAGSEPSLLALQSRWAPLRADAAATVSTNADWEMVFASPDALARALALHAGSGRNDYRKMSRDAAILKAVPAAHQRAQAESIFFMGFRISGNRAYAGAEYRDRVIALLGAMERSLSRPPPPPSYPQRPPQPVDAEHPVPAPDEASARGQWDQHPSIHWAFSGQFANYLRMAPLYAARGVGDAADYLARNIIGLTFFGHHVQGHRDLQPILAAVEAELGPAGPVPPIGPDGFDCFNARPIRGTVSHLSNHALGRAIDLNPGANRRITKPEDFLVIDAVTGGNVLQTSSPAELRRLSSLFVERFGDAWIAQQTNPDVVAACRSAAVISRLKDYARTGFCTLDQRLIEGLISRGLRWGGAYATSKDFMHFEFVRA